MILTNNKRVIDWKNRERLKSFTSPQKRLPFLAPEKGSIYCGRKSVDSTKKKFDQSTYRITPLYEILGCVVVGNWGKLVVRQVWNIVCLVNDGI